MDSAINGIGINLAIFGSIPAEINPFKSNVPSDQIDPFY
jgi:hypothetical protein